MWSISSHTLFPYTTLFRSHRATHADRIDLRRGGERPDRHRNVVSPARGVDHVGEQERAPLILPQSSLELPTHQRMQFGIRSEEHTSELRHRCISYAVFCSK